MFTRSKQNSTLCLISFLEFLVNNFNGNATFSSTVMLSKSAEYWKSIPMFFRKFRTSLNSAVKNSKPSYMIEPLSGRIRPTMHFIMTDLPLPLSPTMASVSFLCKSNVIFSVPSVVSFSLTNWMIARRNQHMSTSNRSSHSQKPAKSWKPESIA